ncbi:basic proline-rich protein-like [Corvus hawaiiensis]|uniref:basic proline-rich protein-like n=1 Tax=Corvus hawaiiensis TaxID=134902 RepID=UPI00201841E2|nr:basic proline-rich protein-like [Corvus hawaiiensis]
MGRGDPAVSRPPLFPPPPHAGQAAGLRAAAERAPTKWSRPGPAPRRCTRVAAAPVHRSAPLPAPVPAGGQRGGRRGSPPAPAGLGLPPAIVRRAPRAGPAPPPRSPRRPPAHRRAGPSPSARLPCRAVRALPSLARRGAAPGARGLVVLAGLRRSRTAALPPALPPPSGAHRPRARPFRRDGPPPPPPQPARGGRRLRRYLRCGPGSPPPAARVRAPRRAAAAPARLGRHGAGGSRGSAGMWHRGGAARAARGAGPGCRPPGCRRGARRGAARADPLPPPAAALCFPPRRPSPARPCGSPRPCWRRAPPAGLGPGAAALHTQTGSARCPGLAAPQAQFFPTETLSWSGCGLAPQRGTEDSPPPCLRTLAAPLEGTWLPGAPMTERGEPGPPSGHVPAWFPPVSPWSVGTWHSTSQRDAGVQGLYRLGSNVQTALGTSSHVHIALSQWGPAAIHLQLCGYRRREEQGSGGRMPSDALPICCVTSARATASARRKGPAPARLFRQRNREMAPRPLPPAPARMCGTAGSVAGSAAAGLCLRAAAGSAGGCGLPAAGFALSPPPRDRAHPQPSPAPSIRRSSAAGGHGAARHCGLPLQAPVPAHSPHGAPTGTAQCPRSRRECASPAPAMAAPRRRRDDAEGTAAPHRGLPPAPPEGDEGVTAGRRGAPDPSAEGAVAHAGPAGVVGRMGWLRVASGRGCSPGRGPGGARTPGAAPGSCTKGRGRRLEAVAVGLDDGRERGRKG